MNDLRRKSAPDQRPAFAHREEKGTATEPTQGKPRLEPERNIDKIVFARAGVSFYADDTMLTIDVSHVELHEFRTGQARRVQQPKDGRISCAKRTVIVYFGFFNDLADFARIQPNTDRNLLSGRA